MKFASVLAVALILAAPSLARQGNQPDIDPDTINVNAPPIETPLTYLNMVANCEARGGIEKTTRHTTDEFSRLVGWCAINDIKPTCDAAYKTACAKSWQCAHSESSNCIEDCTTGLATQEKIDACAASASRDGLCPDKDLPDPTECIEGLKKISADEATAFAKTGQTQDHDSQHKGQPKKDKSP